MRKYVIILGIVSLLTDISSEMIFPILPIFLEKFLYATKTQIGLIEGLAALITSFLKVFSGYLSDKIGKRKLLVVLGYTLSAFSKPLLYFATSWIDVLWIRALERTGKGVRTAPRDAMISSFSEGKSGQAFGIHRGMDTAGAVLGSLFTFLFLIYFGETEENFRKIFLYAFFPAIAAVVILIAFVKEPKINKTSSEIKISFKDLPSDFKKFVIIQSVFTLFTMNYTFIILKANDVGISIGFIPLAYLLFNIVYAFSSFPFGIFSDKIEKTKAMLLTYILFSITSFVFLIKNSFFGWLGFIFYGIFMSGYEVVSRAFISDLIKSEKIKGSAYGIYHTLIGITSFLSMLIAGILWDKFGSYMPFLISCVISLFLSFTFGKLFR
ncbi:MFS transporter [Persephonella sp.]|uniref:MFS transporter n=1 Tax=Persephonella sp. TaxID=2060922 RepID=UPI002608FB1A|nr:MFS transporter [Persephonella sp.]